MNLEIRQEVTPHEEGWWDWAVWLDGPEDELEEVEDVEYILHPTFPNPVQKIDNRATNFRLNARGWGEFNIQAHVHLENGETIRLEHWLELDMVAPTRTIQESFMKRPRFRAKVEHPMLYLSSAMADMKYSYALKDALEEEGLAVLMNQDLDDDEPLEMLLETKQASFDACLFVISDIRNPSIKHEYWIVRKSNITSLVVQIGEPRDFPDEMEDLPRFQLKDTSETEDVAANIARRVRGQI
jgi:transcription initiation factor IIF auxiliary subunit